MATVIRPELSTQNKYHLPKHRYYELKHFCMQYPDWENEYRRLELCGIPEASFDIYSHGEPSDPTARLAMLKTIYSDKLGMVDACCETTDRDIGPYIKVAVIQGCTYDKLNARLCVPCGRKEFYELYRRFFYILDKERR